MPDSPPLAEAYFAAVEAIVAVVGTKPLPAGLTTARVGDWQLTVNNGREPLDHEGQEVGPWGLLGVHEVYVAIVTMNPVGGAFANYSKDQFIADMKAGSPSKQEATDA